MVVLAHGESNQTRGKNALVKNTWKRFTGRNSRGAIHRAVGASETPTGPIFF